MPRWIPAGYVVKGSRGSGSYPHVPWIAVFDPDETDSAQHGIYVVYLFAVELQTVVLSLNQGVTEFKNKYKREVRKPLASHAKSIREALPEAARDGLEAAINLPRVRNSDLPANYMSGNIVARTYSVDRLPDNDTLVADLNRFLDLYDLALTTKNAQLGTATEVYYPPVDVSVDLPLHTPSSSFFKPKDDSDYFQSIAARTLKKSRKHETLVREYGQFLGGRGFTPNTNVHPRDMIAVRDPKTWLFEVKTVGFRHGSIAAREALGQLFAYHFRFHRQDPAELAAVFNEDIGPWSVSFLEAYGIAAVWWRVGGGWDGSRRAQEAGLCQ